MGSVGPLGVFTPSGLVQDQRGRTHCCADNALRAPSASLQRPIAAPPHRPEIPKDLSTDDASFPGLSCPTTHAGTADPFVRGASKPHGVPRARFGYLLRGVHHHSCESLAAPERPRAFRFEAFSSRRSDSLSEVPALLPFPASIRLAPIGACGRDRLQGLDPDTSSFCPSSPCERDASMPPCDSSLQSVLLLCPCERFMVSRPLPHHALGGITSRPACVSRSCGTEESAGPFRGCQLS